MSSTIETKAIARRRGDDSAFKKFEDGLEGEITVNTSKWSLVVSDGEGNNYEAARADLSNVDLTTVANTGLALNDLSNTVLKYEYDSETKKRVSIKKSANEIKKQLYDAYIADKDLTYIPLQTLTNKGVARYDLQNVSVEALSWAVELDDGTAIPVEERRNDHVGGLTETEENETAGGFIYKNFSNLTTHQKAESPFALKSLDNVTLTAESFENLDIAKKDLSNVTSTDFWNAPFSLTILKSDFSNASYVSASNLALANIADQNLTNVDWSKVEGLDFVRRDFSNVTVDGFYNSTVGQVTMKIDMSNVTEAISADNLNNAGIAMNTLENVDLDVYKASEIGQYTAAADFSNVKNVPTLNLTKAGIADINLSNVDTAAFEGKFANKTLSNVASTVFTDDFSLMLKDGLNADKETVFKGIKNLLVNSDFNLKHPDFIENGLDESGVILNPAVNTGDVCYSNWVAMTDNSRMSVVGKEVVFTGSWYQAIPWSSDLLDTDLYFSVDTAENLKVKIGQFYNNLFNVIGEETEVTVLDEDYNRKYVVLNTENAIEGYPLILVITNKDSNAKLKNAQLELNNVSNWEHKNKQIKEVESQKNNVVFLNIASTKPTTVKESCYRVNATSTTDTHVYYVKASDIAQTPAAGEQVVAGTRVYTVDPTLTLVKKAASNEFTFDGPTKADVNLYAEGQLVYAKDVKKIYTFTNDAFYYVNDPVPYSKTVYIEDVNSIKNRYLWSNINGLVLQSDSANTLYQNSEVLNSSTSSLDPEVFNVAISMSEKSYRLMATKTAKFYIDIDTLLDTYDYDVNTQIDIQLIIDTRPVTDTTSTFSFINKVSGVEIPLQTTLKSGHVYKLVLSSVVGQDYLSYTGHTAKTPDKEMFDFYVEQETILA